MNVKLLFFGEFRFKMGRDSLEIELPDKTTISGLKGALTERWPDIFSGGVPILFARNNDFLTDHNTELKPSDEIAVMPPLGGGEDFSWSLVDDPLPLSPIVIPREDCGATLVFDGTVRKDHDDGQQVQSLFYDCYREMAAVKFDQLLQETREKFPQLRKVEIIHRIGRIAVGEASLRVVVQSPHRRESLEAMDFIILRIKEIVPIFKVVTNPLD